MSWRDLLAYWRSKHLGGVPPSRANLDPVCEIPKLVRSLILVDRLAGGYRFRLIGSEIVSRAGCDGTGKPVSTAPYAPSVLNVWIESMDRAVRAREPQLMRSHLKSGGSLLTLILPLVAPDGSTEMILGGAFAEGPSDGFWQPVSIERLDLKTHSAEAPRADYSARGGSILGPNWNAKFQT